MSCHALTTLLLLPYHHYYDVDDVKIYKPTTRLHTHIHNSLTRLILHSFIHLSTTSIQKSSSLSREESYVCIFISLHMLYEKWGSEEKRIPKYKMMRWKGKEERGNSTCLLSGKGKRMMREKIPYFGSGFLLLDDAHEDFLWYVEWVKNEVKI